MSAIVMKVISKEKHPNADTLFVYSMEESKLGILQIVANLENVYEIGDHAIIVTDGTVLKDGTAINDTKIRGIKSFGMALGKTDKAVGTDLSEEYCKKASKHIKWPDIEGLHNIVRAAKKETERPKIKYLPKVKLHGTNAAVQILSDGEIFIQSRTNLISLNNDNAGFAAWVNNNINYFKALVTENSFIIYGEWCGPGIMKGTAINKINNKIFAIFAIQINSKFIIEPTEIKSFIKDHNEIYVLPWYGNAIELDFYDMENLNKSIEKINQEIELIEKTDPWVKETFNIEDVGEGLVYYPIEKDGEKLSARMDISDWIFKAKGEKHRVAHQKQAAQTQPEIASGAREFVKNFLTEARLEQGVNSSCNNEYDIRKMGDFLKWTCQDVKKESVAELEVSGLEWKAVSKLVAFEARAWYQNKCKNIGA